MAKKTKKTELVSVRELIDLLQEVGYGADLGTNHGDWLEDIEPVTVTHGDGGKAYYRAGDLRRVLLEIESGPVDEEGDPRLRAIRLTRVEREILRAELGTDHVDTPKWRGDQEVK